MIRSYVGEEEYRVGSDVVCLVDCRPFHIEHPWGYTGCLFAWMVGGMDVREGGALMFEGFTLPPLFWPIFMLIATVVLVPPAYIIPLWRWCKKPQREFQEDVEKALEHVSQALNPAQLNPAHPGNIHAIRYEAQKATDRIISRLKRKRRQPPEKLDLGDSFLVRTNPYNDSLREWQDYLRNLMAE